MKKLKTTTLHDRWVKVEQCEFEFDDGRKQNYDIVRLGWGIGVLPFLKGSYDVLLIRQYRPPLEQEFLEIIHGRCEPGEKTIDTARRELLEETGCTGKLDFLCNYKPLSSTLDAQLDIFTATDVEKVQVQSLDEFEQLEVVRMPFLQLYQEVLQGRHTDAALQLAVYRTVLKPPF